MKPGFAYLRNRGFVSSIHVDNIYLQGDTFEKCLQNVQETVKLLQDMGFCVSMEKSVLTHSQTLNHLGFTLDSTHMTVKLASEKFTNICSIAQPLLTGEPHSILEVAKLVGTFVAAMPGG